METRSSIRRKRLREEISGSEFSTSAGGRVKVRKTLLSALSSLGNELSSSGEENSSSSSGEEMSDGEVFSYLSGLCESQEENSPVESLDCDEELRPLSESPECSSSDLDRTQEILKDQSFSLESSEGSPLYIPGPFDLLSSQNSNPSGSLERETIPDELILSSEESRNLESELEVSNPPEEVHSQENSDDFSQKLKEVSSKKLKQMKLLISNGLPVSSIGDKELFNFRGKSLFCTYAQSGSRTMEECRDAILERWNSNIKKDQNIVSWILVAQETHKDGGNHIHCQIGFKKRVSFTGSGFADFISGGLHGNYRSVRSQIAVYLYCTKDGKYILWGDIPKGFEEKRIKRDERIKSGKGKKESQAKITLQKISLEIMEGKSLREICREYPDRFLLYQDRILKMIEFVKNLQVEKLPWRLLQTDHCHQDVQPIFQWLNKNILQERSFKQKQLYIHGPPNIGKTSLIHQIEKRVRVFYVPMNEDFYGGYDDDNYDLLVMDEFVGQKSLSFMNQFLDGSTMNIRIKGGQVTKRKNLPCIILSNYSPEMNYKKRYQENWLALEPLKARLEIVDLSDQPQEFCIFYKEIPEPFKDVTPLEP